MSQSSHRNDGAVKPMVDSYSPASSKARPVAALARLLSAPRLSRVLVVVGLLIVSIAAVFAAFFVTSLHDSELKAIRNRLEIPAQAMAHGLQQIASHADLMMQAIRTAIKNDRPLDDQGPTLQQLLVDRVYARSASQKIEIYDLAGKRIAGSIADPSAALAVTDLEFFKRQATASGDQLIVSGQVHDATDGRMKIVLSRPIIDRDGVARGVIADYVDATYVQQLFDTLPMPHGSVIVLFTKNGQHLLRSPAPAPGEKIIDLNFSQHAPFRAFRDSGAEGAFMEFKTLVSGTDRFVAGVGEPDSPFVVTAGWDASSALAHWRGVASGIVAATIAAIAVVSGLFVYVLLALRRNEVLLVEVSRSEGKFRALMAALPDAVMIIDQSLKIVFANRAAEKLFGYAANEMNGLALRQTMVADTRSTHEQNLSGAFTSSTLRSGVQGLVRVATRKDGSELPVEINACPYETPEGRLLVSVVRDISERQAKDRALIRSRENLTRAQRLAGIGSFERDLITGERELSDEFKRIWGIDDASSGRLRDVLTPLVHPDDRQRYHEMREAAFHDKPSPPWDFRITRPDGEERIVHPEFRVIFDEKGTPLRMFGTVQDITERKKIEIELRRSREKLARAHQIAGIGNFERDLVTGEVEWSDEFLRIWGISGKATHGTAEYLSSLVHPEDREKFMAGRDAALGRKPLPPLDFRIIRPDGEERILHREYGVQFDDKGKAIRMFGTVQDVTERKRIEIELRRSRENLARAQRIVGMGSFDRDLTSNKAEWSEEMYRILGIEKTEGASSYDAFISVVHPEDRARMSAAIMAEMKGTRAGSLECRIVRADGKERIVCRESDVVLDEDGRPIRVFGTVQDITERKKAELELLRSREALARAQRFAGMGSFERDLVTADGEWSEEMYRILGIEKRDAVPEYNTLMNLVHPDDRKMFQAFRAAEINGTPSQPLEYRIVRPDGVERIVRRESAVVFDDEKRPVRLHGTLQDITEQRLAERRERELERQLLHSQKLEALGTLAGGIAHDLNNTLVPIMALSKLSARRFEAGSLVRANLETIYEASERARDLVKRVVAFSRKDESEKRDTDIAEIVDEALKLLRATIPSSITLETQIAKVPPIPADASQIHQIVTNLVSNASQAIGGDIGTIGVTLDLRSETPDRGEICLSVSDTGMGMDQATQQRIFEPFFTTKPVGQGTGLGLSIVHGIVAGHGGRIEVTSAPGAGTRIDLYFPLATATAGITSSRPAA
jgi:PAS domain S-box-containing protein